MNYEKIVPVSPVDTRNKLARLYTLFIPLAVILGVLAGGAVVFINNPLYILLTLAGLVVFLLSLYLEEFGLLVLVFISYSRFSDILIEYHGFISIAKPFVWF